MECVRHEGFMECGYVSNLCGTWESGNHPGMWEACRFHGMWETEDLHGMWEACR